MSDRSARRSTGSKMKASFQILHTVWAKDSKTLVSKALRGIHTALSLADIWIKDDVDSYYKRQGQLHREHSELVYESLLGYQKPETAFADGDGTIVQRFRFFGTVVYFVKHGKFVYSGFRTKEKDFYRKWKNWFWETYGPHCTFKSIKNEEQWGWQNIPQKLSVYSSEYFGDERQQELMRHWEAFKKEGFTRALLFEGPPGTGKTTIALKMAEVIEGRVLHLPARLFSFGWDAPTVLNIFKVLRPDVVVIEDIHTLGDSTSKNMLHLLEWAPHEIQADTLIIATTNHVERLSDAMKRPGRFDEIIQFPAPTEEKRLAVLEGYADFFGCRGIFDHEYLAQVAEKTEGLTESYLREIAKTAKAYSNAYDMETTRKKLSEKIENMRRLNGLDDDDDEDGEDSDIDEVFASMGWEVSKASDEDLKKAVRKKIKKKRRIKKLSED